MNSGDYVLNWWDSMGMGNQTMRGNFVDDVLSVSCAGPMGHNRCTFDVKEPGRYAFVMEVSQDGENWMTAMTGDYNIAKAKAASGAKKSAQPAKKSAKPAKKAKAKKKPAAKKPAAKVR